MAKHKNRKKPAPGEASTKKSAPAKSKEPGKPQKPAEPVINRQPITDKPAETGNPPAQKGLVRVSTCIAGMFLTLIMGIYLGSLLPDIMNGLTKERTVSERPVAPAAVQQTPVAPQASPENQIQKETVVPTTTGVSGEFAAHLRHLESEALDNPSSSRVWTDLGNAYFDLQQPQKAIVAYEHSLALAPENPDVLTDLGIMYRELKNYEKALECFRKATRLDPGHINALFNQGVVLSSDLGHKEEAARVWQKILEIRPDATTPDGHKISDMVRQLQ